MLPRVGTQDERLVNRRALGRPRVTVLAWCLAALLLALVVFAAVAAGVSPFAFVLLGILLGAWVAVGVWVRRDAQRRGYDGDRMGGGVVVLGFVGLAYWLGIRRGLDDKQ
jgi:hypothetical protein